ncbi:hypothetical protein [Spirosoma aerophilum]
MSEFQNRFWFCLALSLPILAYSTALQQQLGYQLELAGRPYLLLIWCTVSFLYGGWLFGLGMVMEVSQRQPGRQTLCLLVASLSYLFSLILFTDQPFEKNWFWLTALLMDGLLLSSYLELKLRGYKSETYKLFQTKWPVTEVEQYTSRLI